MNRFIMIAMVLALGGGLVNAIGKSGDGGMVSPTDLTDQHAHDVAKYVFNTALAQGWDDILTKFDQDYMRTVYDKEDRHLSDHMAYLDEWREVAAEAITNQGGKAVLIAEPAGNPHNLEVWRVKLRYLVTDYKEDKVAEFKEVVHLAQNNRHWKIVNHLKFPENQTKIFEDWCSLRAKRNGYC